MPSEPPFPAAKADDDATSNPSIAAHNKLIFVIGGVPLFCRKRPAFLIKPKRQVGFCSKWDCGILSPWNYGPARNLGVCKFKNFLRGRDRGAGHELSVLAEELG